MRFYPLNRILGFFSHDIGIDLGTANTLVYVKGKGIVVREPSVLARHKKTKEILAIGTSARKMLGRAPTTIEVIRPLKDGVISDFDATTAMLSYYIKKIHESTGTIPKIPRPKVIIGIPSGVTEVKEEPYRMRFWMPEQERCILLRNQWRLQLGQIFRLNLLMEFLLLILGVGPAKWQLFLMAE